MAKGGMGMGMHGHGHGHFARHFDHRFRFFNRFNGNPFLFGGGWGWGGYGDNGYGNTTVRSFSASGPSGGTNVRRETGCVRNISSTREHQPSLTQPSLTAQKRLGEQGPRNNKGQSACRKLPATLTTPTVVAADATNRWGSHTQSQKRATQ
jgi:hypothetical protein